MASAWRVSTAAASCWPAGATPCSMMAWGSAWCHGGLSSNNDSVCRFLRRYMTAAYPGKSDGNRAYLLSEASSISSTHCKDASTSVLDVDDRNAPDAHAAQRHLSGDQHRSEEHTSELQSPCNLVCRLLLEKKKTSIGSRVAALRVDARVAEPVPLPYPFGSGSGPLDDVPAVLVDR